MQVTIDLARIREETPGTRSGLYLHAAGAALMPRAVTDAVKAHLDLESEVGGYTAADRMAPHLSNLYASVGALINAGSDEIALCESATVAWQRAFYGLQFNRGDRIITAQAEYGANYVAFLQMARRTGAEIIVVPNDESGALDLAALSAAIDERVRLIAITWIPTNGGLVNPAAAVGRIARRHGIPYLVDACQAVGQMRVDVEEIGCDMLAATGRKFLRGPRGTGFLFIRRDFVDAAEPAMIDHAGAQWTARDRYTLRADARRYETWENSVANRLGLAAAVDYALGVGIDAIGVRCRHLSSLLRSGLAALDGVKVRDLGQDLCSIVSFTIDRTDARDFVRACGKADITVGVSYPASTRLDAEARDLPVTVRASPHYYNTEEEIDRLLMFVRSCVAPRFGR